MGQSNIAGQTELKISETGGGADHGFRWPVTESVTGAASNFEMDQTGEAVPKEPCRRLLSGPALGPQIRNSNAATLVCRSAVS